MDLDTSTHDKVQIHLKKEVYSDLENCEENLDLDFDACSKDEIIKSLNSELSCKPVTLKHLELSPNDCSTEEDTKKALAKVKDILNKDTGKGFQRGFVEVQKIARVKDF